MRRWLLGVGLSLALSCGAAETDHVTAAMQAVKTGNAHEAVRLISAGIAAQPRETRLLNVRSQIYQLMGKHDAAEKDLTAAIALEGASGWLFQERAQLRFRLGRVEESVADFNRANELSPKLAPQNWQRGIALYYLGRFADGRKQFELHRTVNPDDVENAVWHFLCIAREVGMEKARKALIPVAGDTRVPMKEIHALFAGKGTEKQVLAAADQGADNATIRTQRFYANFYIALYYEAAGEREKVEDNLRMALILADATNYMGVVARVHADRLAAKAEKRP